MKQAGYNDLNSMMQAIEQQDLLQRAEKFGVTPEIQQKLEALEQKAQPCRGTRVSARTTRIITTFYASIRQFAQEKELMPRLLEQFMVEHNVPNFEVAYNAMRTQRVRRTADFSKRNGHSGIFTK